MKIVVAVGACSAVLLLVILGVTISEISIGVITSILVGALGGFAISLLGKVFPFHMGNLFRAPVESEAFTNRVAWTSVGMAMFFIGIPHCLIAITLAPERAAFEEVALHACETNWETNEAGEYGMDCGGRAKAIITHRDATLAHYHFMKVGRWRIVNRDASFNALYVFAP